MSIDEFWDSDIESEVLLVCSARPPLASPPAEERQS